jgi:hypothetical protein
LCLKVNILGEEEIENNPFLEFSKQKLGSLLNDLEGEFDEVVEELRQNKPGEELL